MHKKLYFLGGDLQGITASVLQRAGKAERTVHRTDPLSPFRLPRFVGPHYGGQGPLMFMADELFPSLNNALISMTVRPSS